MRLPGLIGCAIVATVLGCAGPPTSPLAGVQASQVSIVSIHAGDGCVGELTSSAEIAEFLFALAAAEPFKQGKVASDLTIEFGLTDGRRIQLRMGPNQIGPPVAGSAVVWRWHLRDARAYAIASDAIERSRKGARCSPTRGQGGSNEKKNFHHASRGRGGYLSASRGRPDD